MQVTETLNEGLKRAFKIQIAAADIAEKVDGRLKELAGTVQLPGFRPGKVPVGLLKKRFGAGLTGEVLQEALQDSSAQAMQERGLRPAGQPKVEVTAYAEGADLEYTLDVEVLPEIVPMDFSTLTLERESAEVTEEEIEKGIARIASQQEKSEPLAEPRPAQTGDTLVIDFAGTVDGVAHDGMSAEGHHLKLGSSSFIAGFEDQLVGAAAGEQREVKVTFPEGYGNDKLAGKDAVFVVTVKEIRQPVPVAIDDEFAKSLGFEQLSGLREAVKGQMEREFGAMGRAKVKRKLLDLLSERHDFAVPAGMVEQEFALIWRQAHPETKEDADLSSVGSEEERAEFRKIAERRVRLGLLLAEVGRLNNIQVGEDEVRRAMFEEARRYPGQERQVIELFSKNPQAQAQLKAPIFEDKVVDFILEMATVTTRTVPPEELFKTEDEGDKAA
ncbi:MAG: trigger factor [Thalassobaculales bacterium]